MANSLLSNYLMALAGECHRGFWQRAFFVRYAYVFMASYLVRLVGVWAKQHIGTTIAWAISGMLLG